MNRPVAVAAAAIGALGIAGFVAIGLLTGDGGRPAPPPPPPAPALVETPPAEAPAPPPDAGSVAELVATSNVMSRPAPVVAALPPAAPPPPPPPAQGSWESVEPAGRPADLGAIGSGFVMAMRNVAAARLSACFDEVVEAQNAATGAVPERSRDANATAIGAPPVLMLELETRAGAVVIVDAPVESQGSAGDGVILCAQRALRGLSLGVPAARPGERHRLRWPLTR